MHAYRTHTCAALTRDNVGDAVRLSGWVHRIRDHGGILFVDLRDHYGMTQVLCDPDSAAFADVDKLRSEWCVRIDGEVKARDPELVNPKLPTGEIEVFVRGVEVLGASKELPLQVFGDQEYPEETRLKYRYLDLRREAMQKNMTLRSDVVASIRKRMWAQDFREYQTPIITASSPEGARDFLVPSRLHPGRFYALPQAPQQFKQLLMVSGFDKYFQIAPCFRDEDPRADRSPTDFYQLDMEMSFVEQQDVFDTIQPVMQGVFEEFGGGRKVDTVWPQISYKDSALWYGTDKPDLRISWVLRDFTPLVTGLGFGIFDGAAAAGGRVRGFVAKGGGSLSRSRIEHYNERARAAGAKGALWLKRGQEGWSGPPAKVLDGEAGARLEAEAGVEPGDLVFFVAGDDAESGPALDLLRREAAAELGAVATGESGWLWVVEFPLFEPDPDTGDPMPAQHPFTMPIDPDPARIREDPFSVTAHAYDIVYNGTEFASGSIRCHLPEVQRAILGTMGLSEDEIERRFGFLLEAFRYGVPPHGGFAVGLDRVIAVMVGSTSIRDVIAFPKTAAARGLMEGSPSTVSAEELAELGIQLASEG